MGPPRGHPLCLPHTWGSWGEQLLRAGTRLCVCRLRAGHGHTALRAAGGRQLPGAPGPAEDGKAHSLEPPLAVLAQDWALCATGLCWAPQVSLGAGARDELHVVAVESKNTYGGCKPVPIASLRGSVLPMVRAGRGGSTLRATQPRWGLHRGIQAVLGAFWLCLQTSLLCPNELGQRFTLCWGWAGGALSFFLFFFFFFQINLKGLEFVPPVTFVLECGAGPVYLSGQHVTRESCFGVGWHRGCSLGPVGL